jgi:hypothetical protein
MTDDEVREWVRGRLTFEAWLRAVHEARDEQLASDDVIVPSFASTPVRTAGKVSWLRTALDRRATSSRRRAVACMAPNTAR